MKLHIHVSIEGIATTGTVTVEASLTFDELKQALQATWGINPSVMCLLKNGVRLQDDQQTVADLGLQDGDTLRLISMGPSVPTMLERMDDNSFNEDGISFDEDDNGFDDDDNGFDEDDNPFDEDEKAFDAAIKDDDKPFVHKSLFEEDNPCLEDDTESEDRNTFYDNHESFSLSTTSHVSATPEMVGSPYIDMMVAEECQAVVGTPMPSVHVGVQTDIRSVTLNGTDDNQGNGTDDHQRNIVTMQDLETVYTWCKKHADLVNFVDGNKKEVRWFMQNMHKMESQVQVMVQKKLEKLTMEWEAKNATLLEETNKELDTMKTKLEELEAEVEHKNTALAEINDIWERRLAALGEACDNEIVTIKEKADERLLEATNMAAASLTSETVAKKHLAHMTAKYEVLLEKWDALSQEY
ncbi:hypothetical protein HDU77_001091 [Chytriomyces hyalinus]|nr:hypothetical protein HDU77_001091 [Chytriomyces hyalinus]